MKWIKSLAFSLLTLVLFFAALEGFSRIYVWKTHRLNEFADLIKQQGFTPQNKKPGERRIFIVGESAARGVPYSMESSFSGFLQKLLNENGHGEIKVINTGMPGRHSFYHREEARTLVEYKADAVILYAGNNDTRDFSNVMRDVPFAWLDFKLAWNSAFYWALKRKIQQIQQVMAQLAHKPALPVNHNQDDVWHWTDTYLRKKKTYLENYGLGQRRKTQAIEDYRQNLNAMAVFLKGRGIPIFITQLPIVHEALPSIGDFPRKGYAFRIRMQFRNYNEERAWKLAFLDGMRNLKKQQYGLALAGFEKAKAINPDYPLLFHYLGESYQGLGQYDKARAGYEEAKDRQIQSPGGDHLKNKALLRIAQENGLVWIPTQSALQKVSPNGIVGRNLFLDHCHPNLLGHKVLAAAVMQGLCGHWIRCKEKSWEDWYQKLAGKIDDQNLAREYLLTGFYFLNGTAWQPQPDYQQAVYYFEKARPMMRDNANLYSFLAVTYWNLGDKAKASDSLEILKRLSPEKYHKVLTDHSALAQLPRS